MTAWPVGARAAGMTAADDRGGTGERRRRGRRLEERLSREDWAEAALQALAEQGPRGINVVALARRLDVARGSFYWHFRNREELLREALRRWRKRSTTDYIAALRRLASPRERLRRLLLEAFVHEPAGRMFVAVAVAAEEPLVAEALEAAVRERLAFLEETFEALGCPPQEARHRARLLHETYVGLWQTERALGERFAALFAPDGLEAHLRFLFETMASEAC